MKTNRLVNRSKKVMFTSMAAVALLGAGTTAGVLASQTTLVNAAAIIADDGQSVLYDFCLPLQGHLWYGTEDEGMYPDLHSDPSATDGFEVTLKIGESRTVAVPVIPRYVPDTPTVTLTQVDAHTLVQEPAVINYVKPALNFDEPASVTYNADFGGYGGGVESEETFVAHPGDIVTIHVPDKEGYTKDKTTMNFKRNSDGTWTCVDSDSVVHYTPVSAGSDNSQSSNNNQSGQDSNNSASNTTNNGPVAGNGSSNATNSNNANHTSNTGSNQVAGNGASKVTNNSNSQAATTNKNAKADVQTGVTQNAMPAIVGSVAAIISALGLAVRKFI